MGRGGGGGDGERWGRRRRREGRGVGGGRGGDGEKSGLRTEEKSQRAVFLPTVMVRDTMQNSRTRKALMKAVKARMADEEVTAHVAGVQEAGSHDQLMSPIST